MITVVTSPRCGYSHRVTNLHVHQILRHKTHNWHNGLFWSVVKKYSHCYWGPPTTTVYLKNISFQISRKLKSWIPETLFELCFECMCVLTIWMLRRFNLLCQVKFTSFRLRLAFLKDFIKIGISSELNSDSLSVLPHTGCYMLHVSCHHNGMVTGQNILRCDPVLWPGQDLLVSIPPGAPCTWWPCDPGLCHHRQGSSSEASQPSTLCRLSNYL